MTVSALPDSTPTSADALVRRLEDPQVAAALNTLLDHAELIAFLATALDGLVRHSETMLESVGDSLADARSGIDYLRSGSGVDVAALAPSLATLAGALPTALPALARLAESGVLADLGSPQTVRLLSTVTRSLDDGVRQFETRPVPVKGTGAVVRLLRDADVRTALSFAATIGRSLGRALSRDRADATTAPAPR